MVWRLPLLLVSVALAGCSSNQAQYSPSPPHRVAVPASGCGLLPPAAEGQSVELAVPAKPATAEGRVSRRYRLHLPQGYLPSQPQPLVLEFHGAGGTAAGDDAGSGFSPLADHHDFLVAYLEAVHLDNGVSAWGNARPLDYGVDDLGYALAVLAAVKAHACVDPARIYVTGFSDGGGMTEMMACYAADKLAASAPMSGNYYADTVQPGCNPARPLPVLEIHGTEDGIVPYPGVGRQQGEFWLWSIPRWLAAWAMRDGCHPQPVTFLQSDAVTGLRWEGCRAGSTVEHYRWDGGGHGLPPSIGGQDPREAVWRFLSAHSLPARR